MAVPLAASLVWCSPAAAQHAAELRVDAVGTAYRWSNDVPESRYEPEYAEKSLHLQIAGALRVFPEAGPHGGLVRAGHLFDIDLDGISAERTFRVHLTLVDVGYAFRHVVPSPLRPERRAWTFTAYGGLSAGTARTAHESEAIPSLSPVVGVRVGVDAHLHIGRFFLGWALDYRLLGHTRGALRRSSILSWNFIPLARIGVDLGAAVQGAGH